MTKRRLLLLGGGHAHIHFLASAARTPLAGTELVLVSPYARHHYSGMVPGYLQGTYDETDLAFDLRALAERAGARFVEANAERIDPLARFVETTLERLPFDLLSLDVGSAAAGFATPGAREHGWSIRPMSRVVALRARAEELFAAAGGRTLAVTIVGGGAAGVEVALALDRLGRGRGARVAVTIVEALPSLLSGFAPRVRRLAGRALTERGIRALTARAVTAVEPDAVVLDDGSRERSDLTVWLAGAAPSPLLATSDLPKDPRGYLHVDATLRAVDGSPLFGAGDCIGIVGYPGLAKAGVYAVRESPVLEGNLRAALAGGKLSTYRPQRSFLALLNTADGRAIWRWQFLSGQSRAAWRLKDRIDRAFVRRYQAAT